MKKFNTHREMLFDAPSVDSFLQISKSFDLKLQIFDTLIKRDENKRYNN